jgi:hypothetical protein
MIRYDCVQGSDEWQRLRIGRVTSSNFHKIVTPKKGELSKQSKGYACALLCERLTHLSLAPIEASEWMERGRQLESEAVRLYEFAEQATTEPVGFLTTDDGRLGCSPDRLVGMTRALEVKCPSPQVHLRYWIDGMGEEYVPQVQGQMLVGGFESVDRYSYYPSWPPLLCRTERDENYVRRLEGALREFCDMVDHWFGKLLEAGFVEAAEEARTQLDALSGEELRRELSDYLGA